MPVNYTIEQEVPRLSVGIFVVDNNRECATPGARNNPLQPGDGERRVAERRLASESDMTEYELPLLQIDESEISLSGAYETVSQVIALRADIRGNEFLTRRNARSFNVLAVDRDNHELHRTWRSEFGRKPADSGFSKIHTRHIPGRTEKVYHRRLHLPNEHTLQRPDINIRKYFKGEVRIAGRLAMFKAVRNG